MTKSQWRSDEELEKRVKGLYDYQQVEVPKIPLKERDKGFQEIMLGYTDEEARLEAQRCMQCQDPPCVKACPAHLNVPGYCQAIVDGDLKRGLQIIMDTFPLPGSCGRICYAPCVDVCLKGVEGQPIEIPRLRRYLADRINQKELNYNIPKPTGKKVAVIGSGPASLTCAYHLLRRGHKAIVFEKNNKPGGTLNTIPEYRLPQKILQGEIDILRWLGVEIKTGQNIAGEGCIDKLLQEYDAVFIGAGAISSWKLDIPGKDLPGTMTGYEFLQRLDMGEAGLLGRSVAIIGAGDVAMDALRTAIRESERIYLIYRRSTEEMTASEGEVIEFGEEALLQELHPATLSLAEKKRKEMIKEIFSRPEPLTMERMVEIDKIVGKKLKKEIFSRLEGKTGKVTVYFLAQPTRILGEDKVVGIECMRMGLGEPDESGRRRPAPIAGSEFTLAVGTVIFALGQKIESSWLGKTSGIELNKQGEIIVDDNGLTTRAKVFAGGDAIRGPTSMIQAIADGKRAAETIDHLLRESNHDPDRR